MIKYYPTYKSEDRTDFSFADRYLEERRTGKYVRIQVKYPLIEDRKASNIDYYSEENRRQFRGTSIKYGHDWNNLSINKSPDLSETRYQFINQVTNESHIPQGYVATESGVEPLTYEPFTNGDPIGNLVVVSGDFSNTLVSGAGGFVAKSINTENMRGERYPYNAETDCGRFNWETSPKFDNPTEPSMRFPNGAIKKKFFKY